jgi:crotonobetainyl-CoA:carnitine CoA-transferase CaiB-like acyl-CoA transferase
MARDSGYATNVQRREQRARIVEVIAGILRDKQRAHWLQVFAQARVPAGPIYRLDELAQDPALRDAGFLYRSQGPDGPIPQVGLGIRFDGRSEGTGLPPPKLGIHTDQVLGSWLSCNASELELLRAQRVI